MQINISLQKKLSVIVEHGGIENYAIDTESNISFVELSLLRNALKM